MTTADHLLTLQQWFSPSFPVGSFAYSHGLETEIAQGRLPDAESLRAHLQDLLHHGSGLNDAILLRAAYDATADLEAVNDLALAFCSAAGRITETRDQGAATAGTLRGLYNLDLPDLAYPVAVGRAALLRALPLEDTVSCYLHAFISNLVSAAMRFVPLGQTDGQKVLCALHPDILQVTQTSRDKTTDDLSNSCFALDIAAMQHDTLPTRMFRS